MSVVVGSKKKALKKKKAPVVKKTFSLQPHIWSWLSQFSNKSEVVNKALDNYFMRESLRENTLFDLDREEIQANIDRIEYVSDEEQREIEEML